MPSTRLLKRDWQKDHVYLVQFPRAGCLPTVSPFALKVETWLRMTNIPYTNISNQFKIKSSKGQIPFIELNGRHVPDSNFIIDHLIEVFDKKDVDQQLTPMEKSYARALHDLVEGSLLWVLVYQRGRDNKWMATDQGFLPAMTGIRKFAFKHLMCARLRKWYVSIGWTQGIGRNTPDEVMTIAKKDLDALSTILGTRKHFFGEKPTTLDCTIFAHLTQFLFCPKGTPDINGYMEQNTPNLVAFVNRMKDAYWPDWDEATKEHSLDTKWKH